MAAVLEVQNLRTEFRMRHSSVVAVDDISFSVGQGECVGIVGESGCGKSTTGLSIMRLLPNNGHVIGGNITLLGRDLLRSARSIWEAIERPRVAVARLQVPRERICGRTEKVVRTVRSTANRTRHREYSSSIRCQAGSSAVRRLVGQIEPGQRPERRRARQL